MLKSLKIIVLTLLIATGGYYVYAAKNPVPCAMPIKYSLGEVNPAFNLTPDQFRAEIDTAADIWSDSIDRKLFAYDPAGKLKINLIYDYRQQTTNELKSLDDDIDNSQDSYNKLKAQYQNLRVSYDSQKAALETETADYTRKQKTYNEQVAYWNAQGGAPTSNYNDLQKQKAALEAQRARIQTQQQQLNKTTDDINSIVAVLNQLVKTLNLNIAQYNTIGTSLGEHFEEGVYVEDAAGKRIDIFEFQDKTQLRRLIAHELGHALGLDHIDDPDGIMNWINTSENTTPTDNDVKALKQLCRL